MAQGSLPGLRRGRRLLGAGRDGPDARPHRRGRGGRARRSRSSPTYSRGSSSRTEERAFVEPRLQHLLGLTERVATDREDLFSAWRLFVERMADQFPVIMVFEDIHWADAALDRVRRVPARPVTRHIRSTSSPSPAPTSSEKHPGWGANVRNFTSLTLEPLADPAIDGLLRGLVPGLPEDAVARIASARTAFRCTPSRPCACCSIAASSSGDGGYQVTGDLSALEVPETLQALIAARLDGLDPEERRLLQDASVLGKTFAPRGLASSPARRGDTAPMLDALARKEMLEFDTDRCPPSAGSTGSSRRSSSASPTRHCRAATGRQSTSPPLPTSPRRRGSTPTRSPRSSRPTSSTRIEPSPTILRDQGPGTRLAQRAAERAAALAATEDAQRAFEGRRRARRQTDGRARLLERAGGSRARERGRHARRLSGWPSRCATEAAATHDVRALRRRWDWPRGSVGTSRRRSS